MKILRQIFIVLVLLPPLALTATVADAASKGKQSDATKAGAAKSTAKPSSNAAGKVPASKARAKKSRKTTAGDAGPSGLAIPRFESLSSEEVNLRAGPGVRYPIAWVFVKKGLPVMVLAEFQYWRKIRDSDGAEGWIHKSLINGKRTAVVLGKVRDLHKEPDAKSAVVARSEAGVLARLLACKGAWCELEAGELRGWIKRAEIFGALPNEIFQ
jgi:SH3-like domain-containing protein